MFSNAGGMVYSEKLGKLPPYLFAELDRLKEEKIKEGVDVIDFGVGDPDLPTPQHIIEKLCSSAGKPENHRYPSYEGLMSFRRAVAEWYEERKGIELDPESEVLALIGSKEGIAHLPLAFLNDGDLTLVPDPGYPVYFIGTILAGGVPHFIPLREENGFLPDFSEIDKDVAKKAKILYLNYPNNPTAAVADSKFYRSAVDFAQENNLIIAHDFAYSEIVFDGYRAESILSVDSAMEVSIEFHSLSKTYNMTGWRIGFAVGNSEILKGLKLVKTNVDSGVFQAVQEAGITALRTPESEIRRIVDVYKERRDALVRGLKKYGFRVEKPKATFYVWCAVPEGTTSMEFSRLLLDRTGIVATPGVGFGEAGEGYVRFALTKGVEDIERAVDRLGELGV